MSTFTLRFPGYVVPYVYISSSLSVDSLPGFKFGQCIPHVLELDNILVETDLLLNGKHNTTDRPG